MLKDALSIIKVTGSRALIMDGHGSLSSLRLTIVDFHPPRIIREKQGNQPLDTEEKSESSSIKIEDGETKLMHPAFEEALVSRLPYSVRRWEHKTLSWILFDEQYFISQVIVSVVFLSFSFTHRSDETANERRRMLYLDGY